MILKRFSVRFRLALWYAGTIFVILSVISAGMYFFAQRGLDRILRDHLDRDATTVSLYLSTSPEATSPWGHVSGNIMFAATLSSRIVYHSEGWCRTFGLFGGQEALELDPYGTWQSRSGRSFRMLRMPIYVEAEELELTVAEEDSAAVNTLRTMSTIIFAGLACGLIFSAFIGYYLAGKSLSPVGAMARKARSISAESLSERLPVANPGDELGQMATVFNETLTRLQDSFDRLRDFTGNVSHELRTPLTAIRSVGELALKKERGTEALRDCIGSMLEEVDRLTMLVDSLLTLARAEAGHIPLTKTALDLAEMSESAVDLLRVLAEEKGQFVSLRLEKGVIVDADETTLRQAAVAILDNAIRCTPAGGRIEVEVRREGAVGKLTISDTGPGFPAADRERIFERFYRAPDGKGGSAGLGLAIARCTVESNGGTITVGEGSGARCIISIPLAVPA